MGKGLVIADDRAAAIDQQANLAAQGRGLRSCSPSINAKGGYGWSAGLFIRASAGRSAQTTCAYHRSARTAPPWAEMAPLATPCRETSVRRLPRLGTPLKNARRTRTLDAAGKSS
jgi:hypothetical protein